MGHADTKWHGPATSVDLAEQNSDSFADDSGPSQAACAWSICPACSLGTSWSGAQPSMSRRIPMYAPFYMHSQSYCFWGNPCKTQCSRIFCHPATSCIPSRYRRLGPTIDSHILHRALNLSPLEVELALASELWFPEFVLDAKSILKYFGQGLKQHVVRKP